MQPSSDNTPIETPNQPQPEPVIPPAFNPVQPNQPGISLGMGGVGVGTGVRLGKVPSGIFCIVLGVAFAGVGFYVYKNSQIPANYARTPGQVVQEAPVYETRTVNGYQQQTVSYAPVIHYSVQGKSYSFQSGSSGNPPPFSIGQSVDVAYNPANPAVAAKNASDKTTPFIGPIFIAIGAVVAVAGAFLILKRS